MTMVDETRDEATPLLHEIEEEADAPNSLMEQLRAKREEIASTRDVFIPITGYEVVGLQARYNLLERPQIVEIGNKVLKETKDRSERQMLILIDTIIQATEGFYTQRTGDSDPVPLEDDAGNHVRLWGQLAQYLGGQSATARDALHFVFGNNEFAIGGHGIVLNRWMGNTSIDVDSELLGELA